jgi:dihydropteroate synthase
VPRMPGQVQAFRHLLPELGARTQVMAVLNATPDSFSDGGRFAGVDAALAHAEAVFAAGADLVDVGGESTRPGSEPVPEAEERRRVIPVIEAIVRRGLGPVSIDTTKASVARAALEAGAGLVNDVSAGTFDPALLAVVAESGVPVVLMHTRSRPRDMQSGQWVYEGGVVAAVRSWLAERVRVAVEAGVHPEAIALDPGIGFGKTVEENCALLGGVEALRGLGHPVLVGTSRKSFLGAITGREVGARMFGTAASVAVAALAGAELVRVHDVAEMVDVVRVVDAVRRACTPPSGRGSTPES